MYYIILYLCIIYLLLVSNAKYLFLKQQGKKLSISYCYEINLSAEQIISVVGAKSLDSPIGAPV